MSITPPNAGRPPRSKTEPGRMFRGFVFFVLGLLVIAGAVVFIIVSLLASNPIGLVPGILGALLGAGVNFFGLTLIYRAISNSVPNGDGGPGETP